MAGMAGTAADADDEKAAALVAQISKQIDHAIDGFLVDGRRQRTDILVICFGVAGDRHAFASQILVGFRKPGRGSDLVELPYYLVAGQAAAIRQRSIDVRQVESVLAAAAGEDLRIHDREPVIDIAHLRTAVALVMTNDARAVEHDVARVPAPLIAENGHQRRHVVAAESDFDRRQGDVQVAVAVKDEKFLAEERERAAQRAAGSLQRRTVETIGDVQAEITAVADGLFDLFAEMTDAQHHAFDAFAAEQVQLMHDEGLSGDDNQRFRQGLRERLQS